MGQTNSKLQMNHDETQLSLDMSHNSIFCVFLMFDLLKTIENFCCWKPTGRKMWSPKVALGKFFCREISENNETKLNSPQPIKHRHLTFFSFSCFSYKGGSFTLQTFLNFLSFRWEISAINSLAQNSKTFNLHFIILRHSDRHMTDSTAGDVISTNTRPNFLSEKLFSVTESYLWNVFDKQNKKVVVASEKLSKNFRFQKWQQNCCFRE